MPLLPGGLAPLGMRIGQGEEAALPGAEARPGELGMGEGWQQVRDPGGEGPGSARSEGDVLYLFS